ncbi:hypothetical protein HOY80DRAFT_467874 [Tuber brumale]|nr:hypothetical protein HOY80DRAFT_467874 [Tuber brumale]
MAMNWTGGTRNRAIKASTASRLQKRYFAKVRAAAQTFVIPSSQGNLPRVFKQKRRTTPEFDIIVKKARADHGETVRKGASPLLQNDKDPTGKRGGKEMEEDIRKARRRMLLEREDWVCTTLSKPLVLKSREEMRKLKTNFHREATQTSSSGSTSSEEEEEGDGDDDDDDSSTLQNDDGNQGTVSITDKDRRRVVYHEGTPELPVYPENEDIYIRIGGSTQKSSASTINPTRSPESTSWSTGINSTAIRGSSADTMLLDIDEHEPMFQFQHITPSVSDIIERKRREARQSGYSSSPLARYPRRRGNPVSEPPGEVGEDDLLIQEVEQVSSPIPSSSVYSTIVLRDSPNAHGRECLCPKAEGVMGYGFSGIARMEGPIDKKIRKAETLEHTHMTSAAFGSSQISWSTSPAERQPYQHQGEQSFDEIASDIVSDGNLINLEPFVGSADGTRTQVEAVPDAERDIHETGEEDEEGRCNESLGMGDPDSSGTEETTESEVEESETEMDQHDHSPGGHQDSTDLMSLDPGEDSVKDILESTDYEWDEEGTATTHEDTGGILGTIHVASTIAHEETSAEVIGARTDDPTPPARENRTAAHSPDQTEHSRAKHSLSGCNNSRGSLGSTVDDQGKFPHSPREHNS